MQSTPRDPPRRRDPHDRAHVDKALPAEVDLATGLPVDKGNRVADRGSTRLQPLERSFVERLVIDVAHFPHITPALFSN